MSNQSLISIALVLCSIGGWYVVLHKYMQLKMMVDKKAVKREMVSPVEPLQPLQEPEIKAEQVINPEKREILNWATIMHLSGFSILTGVVFLNIIVPTIIWLLKKEKHPCLSKHGRAVINFQISLTLIQLICLLLGTLMVWLVPGAVSSLFAWTKSLRIIFSTGFYLPFNIFTALPFFWGCVMMLRGAVAAYHGIMFQYPYSTEFVTAKPSPVAKVDKTEAQTSPNHANHVRVNFS